MAYVLNLFTPETWEAFQKHGSSVSGFKYRQRRMAKEHVAPGDMFVCYLVRLSRWCGLLETKSTAYEDDTPIFANPDPYVIRFRVNPVVQLAPEQSIPIFEPEIWTKLSETRDYDIGTSGWTGLFRASLRQIADHDGEVLREALHRQAADPKTYAYSARDRRQLSRTSTVRTVDREVSVEVPDDSYGADVPTAAVSPVVALDEVRQSLQMQGKIARIGAEMGFRIWVPRNDKQRVLDQVSAEYHGAFLANLPLNYDDTTLRTIENIDVLWLKGRAMARAFEVEHSTAVYSGLLRMADLLALQPNMEIRLHIVAPEDKREKVLREIKRPVFSLLDRGPLYESCTYLSYDSVARLGDIPHLSHMSDSIIEEYEEYAQEE
jgi:hypothetical protein